MGAGLSFIKVSAEELAQVSAQLKSTATQVARDSAQALGLVNGLVDQGWEGAASSQFDALFTQWKKTADKLIESPNGVSTLLNNARTTYADTEQSIARSMSH
jgi:WXG100 family type VII secretion target